MYAILSIEHFGICKFLLTVRLATSWSKHALKEYMQGLGDLPSVRSLHSLNVDLLFFRSGMGKKKTKIVGKISSSICSQYNISCYADYDILQSLGLISHVNKHANEFISVDSFNQTLVNIDKVISFPYYVYYDSVKNSLRYYKKLTEYVCVVVNIVNDYAFVSTIYPVNKRMIDNLKNKNKF